MAYKFPELFPLKNVWMACLCFLHLIKWINKTCLHHALQNWKFIDLLNNQHILQRRWRKIYGICYRTLKQDLGRATKYQNSIKVYGQPIRRRRNCKTCSHHFFFLLIRSRRSSTVSPSQSMDVVVYQDKSIAA